jgi:ribosomal protein S18 acetylase RimI-like enzyme
MSVNYREAQDVDFPAVAAMHYPVWLESNSGVMSPFVLDQFDGPETWPDERYRKTLRPPGWAMWIADDGGQVVGMTMFGPVPNDPSLVELDSLYVATREQGIGSSLLQKALDSQPSDDVILWVAEKNQRTRNFYWNRGFRPDDRAWMWEPAPGLRVPQLGYRLNRSVSAP